MESYIIIVLCLAAFAAGFIDAIVGGGGLIQTPVGLIMLPNLSVSTVIGTLKIPAFSGTSFAAYQYLKKVDMNWKILIIIMVLAFPSAFLGSTLLTYVSNDFMKPLLLVVLSLLVIYTYAKKNFGQQIIKSHSVRTQVLYGVLISFIVGFYDGFIGPGTGSFLVLAFISLMGFDFLHASANAKMVNLSTNFGSICLFALKGKIIWAIAIPMAICNAFGGWIGAKLAINRGNNFIRIFFLVVIIGTLIRFGYDVFYK
ncbi:sulfite exporter TauE/SafE family protein [Flavobacterium cellulosilyticum]|uniref:Probable membrane transporter protein n=1 Tax=Flavobacterium cellulosilyticum TaxID=2541731 RepID=A0A4R5C4D1_9FLAO|nr:TSUP family transporter [Flavobacterium cellulosilyticum]TDD93815.1 sulfite exporter TauE/SafE family protein [Flavobacterium cellulosilyticum]